MPNEFPEAQVAGPEEDTRQRRESSPERARPGDLELGRWRWPVASGLVLWSDAVYRSCGLEPDPSASGFVEMQRLFAPESWVRLTRAAERAVAGGEPCRLEAELALPDGTRRWVLMRGEVAKRDGEGSVSELCGTVEDVTDRKEAEQRLARSEARYRSLVLASSEVVWTATPDGSEQETSAEWLAFTGQGRREMRGYGWTEALHPEDRERTLTAWRRAIEKGTKFQIEHRLLRHDGVYRWMRACAVPSRNGAGHIVEWVGMHTDITEQVEAEAALRDTQARFQRLYDANIIGITYRDRHGAFFDGNDELLRIVGYSRDEMSDGGVCWDRITPPEFLPVDAIHIVEADQHGSCTPYEKEYIRRDGTRVPVLVGYALLDGSTDDYIGFVLDLTAQKQAEREVREREQRFRELAEALPELIWMTRDDGWNEYMNRRFAEYTGIPADELQGAMQTQIIHPEDRERTMSRWMHSLATGEEYVNTLRLRRHDGEYRYFLARSLPIRNAEGAVERWLGTATDVHDQRMAEETLRRTEKLAAMGRLAASIAHEINNPLAAVTNSLYLALQMEMSPEAREYLQLAEQELARVAQVTTQTLRFHRQSAAAALVDVGELMDSVISLYAGRLRALDIALDRQYRERERLLCFGDELRQVFANLLSNAVDATQRGGRIVVRIRAGCDWSGESHSGSSAGAPRRGVRVTIADNGHGIGPEVRRRIFEPFVSTKEATGTGLGLWAADGIVRKHGGRIAVRSRTARPAGTVFMLFLPLLPVNTEFSPATAVAAGAMN